MSIKNNYSYYNLLKNTQYKKVNRDIKNIRGEEEGEVFVCDQC